jgi:ABC-type glutathione transport system ATPase component
MSSGTYRISVRSGDRHIVSIDEYPVAWNDITFLFGESGIGKSMLSKAVYGLLDPDELTVEINTRPYGEYLKDKFTKEIQRHGFFVFQEPSSHLNPLEKITTQLTEGSLQSTPAGDGNLAGLWQGKDDAAIGRILDVFPKPYRPSGGEKQRVLLAMAFKKIDLTMRDAPADTPALFVFDEPTGSLDDRYRNLFLSMLLQKYRRRAFTVLIITHDYSIISEIYRAHKDLVNRVHFRELSRESDRAVAVRSFSPDDYIGWLHENRGGARVAAREETVLDVEPEMAIFGRKLRICKDPARTQSAHMVLRKGEMAYLKAPSGIGKTTVAKIIMGLYAPQRFSMTLCGKQFTEKTAPERWNKTVWGKRAGMVFQHADESLNLQARVKEVFAGLPVKTALTTDAITGLLQGLFAGEIDDSFLGKKVAFLSGGQKQRLNLLRTLVLDTDLVILDEPLNGLDFDSIKKVIAILDEKRRHGISLLMISHNEEIFDAIVEPEHVYYLAEV